MEELLLLTASCALYSLSLHKPRFVDQYVDGTVQLNNDQGRQLSHGIHAGSLFL